MTVVNNANLCSTVVFLEFIPVDRAEISHMNEHTTEFVPVTEPARLPGSYEEALRPGSNAVLMSLTQFNQLGSCEVRCLTQLSSTDFSWSG